MREVVFKAKAHHLGAFGRINCVTLEPPFVWVATLFTGDYPDIKIGDTLKIKVRKTEDRVPHLYSKEMDAILQKGLSYVDPRTSLNHYYITQRVGPRAGRVIQIHSELIPLSYLDIVGYEVTICK